MAVFDVFADELARYGYPVLFAGVLLENAGVPVPGETAVLAAGFLASRGYFDIIWVIALTFLAAVIGDNVGFYLGHRWGRRRLQQGKWFLFLTPKALHLAEGYFQRYGVWTIFFARFISGLRVVGALAAGTAGMHWLHFALANAGGALAWAVTMSLVGYFFGHSAEAVHHFLGAGGLIILGSVIVLVSLPFILKHLRKLPLGKLNRVALAHVGLGIVGAIVEVVCIALLVQSAQGEHRNEVDAAVKSWFDIISQTASWLHYLANGGTALNSLPVVYGLALALLLEQWWRRRSWRECVVLLWAVVASEIVGVILRALFHHRDIEPATTAIWPYGFAGLLPLRALVVWGTMTLLIARRDHFWGGVAGTAALVLVLLGGFGVIWHERQEFTEVLLEYAAGAVILFAGLWWLEGLWPGLFPYSSQESPPAAPPSNSNEK
jgi:membrane protein DedA with SNARE-associated domain